jgi:sulfatase modifying factor 1
MQRQVFISHAADDEAWPQDDVEAVADAIRAAGIAVHLDYWHLRQKRRFLSPAEWRVWMDAVMADATHVLCLVSPRYQQLWQRRPDEPGGLGVAFESMRLIHALYEYKQHGDGRILTLRRDSHDRSCIPRDLVLDSPAYRWAADREMVLSHLAEADLPASVLLRGQTAPAPAPVPAVPPASASVPPTPAAAPTRAPAPAPSANRAAPEPQPLRLGPAWASASGRDEYGHWADLTIHGETQRMRWIPPTGPEGFWMGSPAAERAAIQDKEICAWANQTEHAPRREHVRMGFWLADTPCTQAFWRTVADIDPSHFSSGADAPQRPVESVSWEDVMTQFIARIAARPGWAQSETVCLPSEVEWEYAARAGTRTAYWWGDAWDAQRGNANDTGLRDWDDAEGTTPVKRYGPNPWGLFDVYGNVLEWCEDVWEERRDAPETRPDVEHGVVRGGSWLDHPGLARAASRDGRNRGLANQYLGFRFALRSPAGPEAQ